MTVVLAEKPSVARDIAAFLGAKTRRDGYLEGNGYQVTWAFGHLVTLKEPEDYDPALKQWSLESLPFIPDRFELKTTDDKRSRDQFAVIKRLFKAADELICATDAGREGELIFRYIQSLVGCTRTSAKRLWLSSLTPESIREAFASMRPLSEYDRLYAAARCRSEADWIVGLNGTRYYTVRYRSGRTVWSVGRVQTPVLAMIAARDAEIGNFRPEPFWELLTRYRDVTFRHTGGRFNSRESAYDYLKQVEGQELRVEKVERQPQKALPPQLYDLNELQRDMNRRYGVSASDTLQLVQALYESKLVTYPRTDSRYLSKDIEKTIPDIFGRLALIRSDVAALDLTALPFTSRIVDDKKVTDHHAIIPTGTLPASLPDEQQRVYEAIVTRFVAAFYPPCEKEVTTVDAQSVDIAFVAKGVRVKHPGWTVLYGADASDEEAENDEQELPEFNVGESGSHQPQVREGKTTPPKHFTENTLLGAMETAGRFVDDTELREALKGRGLGTPAWRSALKRGPPGVRNRH